MCDVKIPAAKCLPNHTSRTSSSAVPPPPPAPAPAPPKRRRRSAIFLARITFCAGTSSARVTSCVLPAQGPRVPRAGVRGRGVSRVNKGVDSGSRGQTTTDQPQARRPSISGCTKPASRPTSKSRAAALGQLAAAGTARTCHDDGAAACPRVERAEEAHHRTLLVHHAANVGIFAEAV